jgi:hypothetical protein
VKAVTTVASEATPAAKMGRKCHVSQHLNNLQVQKHFGNMKVM